MRGRRMLELLLKWRETGDKPLIYPLSSPFMKGRTCLSKCIRFPLMRTLTAPMTKMVSVSVL